MKALAIVVTLLLAGCLPAESPVYPPPRQPTQIEQPRQQEPEVVYIYDDDDDDYYYCRKGYNCEKPSNNNYYSGNTSGKPKAVAPSIRSNATPPSTPAYKPVPKATGGTPFGNRVARAAPQFTRSPASKSSKR